jgi:hypothetical protein
VAKLSTGPHLAARWSGYSAVGGRLVERDVVGGRPSSSSFVAVILMVPSATLRPKVSERSVILS